MPGTYGGDKILKKGYAYFVEIILGALIISLILITNFEFESTHFDAKQREVLREIGFSAMKNLEEMGILREALSEKNFSKIETYLDASLPDTINFKLSYINDSCYPISNGELGTAQPYCSGIDENIDKEVVSIYYSCGANGLETIKINLWRVL